MGGLDVVDARYGQLWERLSEVLGRDERVSSIEIGGSIGTGTADAWSDLDVHVVAHADRHDELLADWPTWLAAITPTVFARTPIAPFIINSLTAEGLTLDIVVYRGESVQFPRQPGYTVGMLSSARFDDVGDALEYAVAEQLRGLAGPFISLVRRDEHVRHLTGVPHILGLLTTVFLAESGAPMPGKLWNTTFTDEQRAVVEALPPVGANRDLLVGFGLAVAERVVSRARPLYPSHGLEWPSALATVAADRVRETLGIDTTAWLF